MAPVLERLRREARFPAGEVAECLGMTREAYLEAEKDANALPLDRLERLSALYHVEEHDILTGTARKPCGDPLRPSGRGADALLPDRALVYEDDKTLRGGKEWSTSVKHPSAAF